jgi:hypothetical protein
MDWQCGRLTPKLMTPALIDLLSEFRIARLAVNENRNETPSSQLASQLL